MTDRQPNDPLPADFKESAERSQAAGIADESAGYVNAIEKEAGHALPSGKAIEGKSSEKPVEGDEESAPRQPGSPG